MDHWLTAVNLKVATKSIVCVHCVCGKPWAKAELIKFWNENLGCDRVSQNLHPSDADFVCKIRRMRMRICRPAKIR